MRIEELQQGSLPFLRLLSGTWRVCRSNLLPLAAYMLIFSGLGPVATMLLPLPLKPADLGSALRLVAMVIPLGLIAGYGGMAVAWSVSRVVSGEPCSPGRALRAALAATPRYLPAALALIIAGVLALGLLSVVMGGLVFAFVATAPHVTAPALVILVGVLGVLAMSLVIIPLLFAGMAFSFFPVVAVLRPVRWTGTLSRSWALVRGRWWRVFWRVTVLSLPGLVLSQLGTRVPMAIPSRAGITLVELLLAVFTTVGVTLLFLHLDFLGPVPASARSGPAPASAETTP